METNADVGMNSKNYEVEQRMAKKLVANWVCNRLDALNSVLLEELYEVSIRADSDLSKACFNVPPELAKAAWVEARRSLAKACEEANRVGPAYEESELKRQKWGRGQELVRKCIGNTAEIEESVRNIDIPPSMINRFPIGRLIPFDHSLICLSNTGGKRAAPCERGGMALCAPMLLREGKRRRPAGSSDLYPSICHGFLADADTTGPGKATVWRY
jgi:hypothetical protein